ncbi:leucine-rich repeat protein [Sporosarcina sp. FSL K6-3457]|uniref:leucine-rich repeat protein n=1 Tax=Sporosarcina sp. FSL K6-3457 TaxID=2978204 RepID=UPI0030F9ECC8
MKKKSISFILFTMLFFLVILSYGQPSHASEGDYTGVENMDSTGSPDGTVTITGYTGLSKDITIPNTLDGKTVTRIGDYAFQDNQLTSVKLPDNLTAIGFEAFFNNRLKSVTLPNTLTSIGIGAFQYNQLTSVTLPDTLDIIRVLAFSNNQLTSVTFLSDSTRIAEQAFSSTQNATDFTIYGHTSSTAKEYADFEGHLFKAITYKVTYDGNYNTGGSVPVDSNEYKRQTAVTTLDNTGQLIKTGYTFNGWNTLADEMGDDYPVGSSFQMKETDVTLYAKWTADTITSVETLADIRVRFGINLTDVNLPLTIAATLTDSTTENVAVIWDGGTPAYNRQKAGTYTFQGQLDTQIGNPNGVIAEVNVIVRPRPTPPPLNIQATMTANEELTEEQLDGSTITVNVSDTNFIMSLTPEYFELQNAPTGLTVSEVKRISPWQVELTLAFDGTRLAQDHDLGLMIQGAALTNGFNITTNNSLRIQKAEIPYKIIIKEGIFEPTKVWTVKLSNEVDAATVQDALYIVDAAGNHLPATFTSEGNQIFIHPPVENYEDGTYTLYITSKLKDKNGTDLKEPIQMIFTIK